MPLFVTSYAWANLGTSLQGFWGATGVVVFSYYPIVFLLVAVALRGLDPALEETAQSLGLGARDLLPGRAAAASPRVARRALLVALDALVEFDAFVALKYQTFSPTSTRSTGSGFSASGAAALSFFSIVLCVVLLFGEARLRGHANYTRVSHGARRATMRYELGRANAAGARGLRAVVAVSSGIPIGMLIDWFSQSSNAGRSSARGEPPATCCRRPSRRSSSASPRRSSRWSSPCRWRCWRSGTGPGRDGPRAGQYLSFALPDLVAAIALAYAASHYARFLYGSFALLVFAEAILFLPFAVVAMRATLGQIEPALEDSARSLGSGPLRALWRVTMPLARPGFVAAGVLVFAFVLGDLVDRAGAAAARLYTLGTEFQANSSTVAFAAAAPFAAVLIGLAMVAAYVLMSRFGKVRALGRR